MGAVGIGQLRYKNSPEMIARYPTYYTPANFPGGIPTASLVRTTTYDAFVSWNIFPNEAMVPYIFGGVGYVNFNPVENVDNKALPNNANNVYKKDVITFPFGAGFELYATDNLVFNGKVTMRVGVSEWLDDLDLTQATSAKDDFATFSVGFSYYVFGDADLDKDGLSNSREKVLGTDPLNPDTDGDGLQDGPEVHKYHSNPLLVDTDADGLPDGAEVNTYNTDPTREDSDSDGLKDGEEVARKTDPAKADTDGDGLLDGDEVLRYKTDPLNTDTDRDGLSDGDEVQTYSTDPIKIDTDADGLNDGDEVNRYKTSPTKADTDGDGLADGVEINQHKTDPNKVDTDDYGLGDGDEVTKFLTNPSKPDTDGDGLKDGEEVKTYNTNPSKADSDADALNDGDEVNKYKTDPAKLDTDAVGLNDGEEVNLHKTNPLRADSDGDGLSDGDEIHGKHPLAPGQRTNPLNKDTDNDAVVDIEDFCPNIAGSKTGSTTVSAKGERMGCPEGPKIGTKVDFPDILYVVNTDEFNYNEPLTAPSLAKLLAYVNQCDNLVVTIEGHASSEGPAKRNQELSEMRAKKVNQWLVQQGMKPSKVQGAIGYGTSNPKVKEPTGKNVTAEELEAARKQNRRITVEVVKNCDSK
ncbi:MAG: OmpA family protein [Ignavibacteria bacterium]|nr:OmpA family protein [Ignavibacteria bacterium]